MHVAVITGQAMHCRDCSDNVWGKGERPDMTFDTLIRNGLLVDGTGAKAYQGNVGIRNGKIARVGRLADATAAEVIHADGQVVAPGFIDIHTHSDLTLLAEPLGMSKVMQGVTTEVTGNCGYSPFPVSPARTEALRQTLSSIFGDAVPWTWQDLDGYREAVAEIGVSLNIAPLVGHSAVRGLVVGFADRAASADEIRAMQYQVERAMEQGAVGFSTGLTLPPSAYGNTAEILSLTRAMARWPGRIYTSHIRGWAGYHVKGVQEAIDIGMATGAPVQVAHMAVNDPRHWGEAETVMGVCEDAVAAGHDITFDVYPYAASSSGFSQCIPTWAQSGGPAALRERLRDPQARRTIRDDMLHEGLFRGWPWLWDRLLVSTTHTEAAKPYEGMTMAEVAHALDMEPVDAALALMDLDDARLGVIFFYRTEEDMKAFLRHPLGMMGSDGYALTPGTRLHTGKPHPRSYGAHARVLGRYVRQEPVLSLEEAVFKMSGQVADRLGLTDRGRLQAGGKADIAVFDPDTVLDRATFEEPHQFAVGISHVLVNGIPVVRQGQHTGQRPGKVLAPT